MTRVGCECDQYSNVNIIFTSTHKSPFIHTRILRYCVNELNLTPILFRSNFLTEVWTLHFLLTLNDYVPRLTPRPILSYRYVTVDVHVS